jgi:hypothetical protein
MEPALALAGFIAISSLVFRRGDELEGQDSSAGTRRATVSGGAAASGAAASGAAGRRVSMHVEEVAVLPAVWRRGLYRAFMRRAVRHFEDMEEFTCGGLRLRWRCRRGTVLEQTAR